MKKIVLNIIVMQFIFIRLFSQFPHPSCGTTYTAGPNIHTCKGGSITAQLASCDWTAGELSYLKGEFLRVYGKGSIRFGANGIDESEILAPASTQYNCHAYAWHLTEGNSNKVWINAVKPSSADSITGCQESNGNLNAYWHPTTGCFYQVSTEAGADKIHYWCGDHSAVKADDYDVSGKYVSKWGNLFLVKHLPEVVIYTSPHLRRYYKGIAPAISGNNPVCHSGSSFKLSNPPLGTIYWSVSNPSVFSVSSSGNPVTVTRIGVNNVYNSTVTLSARTGSTSGPVIASMFIDACEMYLGGPEFVGCNDYFYYFTPLVSGVAHSWSSEYGNMQLFSSSGNWATFYVPYPNGGYAEDNIKVTVTINGVNYNMSLGVQINCSKSPSNAYPNPVKDILTVEIYQSTQRQAVAPNYDIRLYNSMDSLVLQTTTRSTTMQFNVSNLPNGVYHLHIYDGISPTPEVQQIVVQH